MNKVKSVIEWIDERAAKVARHSGRFASIFVWIYGSLFLLCGMFGIAGMFYEFCITQQINMPGLISFIGMYFDPKTAATFALIGALLIDRNKDGRPDKWEKEIDRDGERSDKQI